jgi:pyridinium-3,5-biscarboxylic acid mononucleotide sulfurtransferase
MTFGLAGTPRTSSALIVGFRCHFNQGLVVVERSSLQCNALDLGPVQCDSTPVVSERYERLRGLLRSYGSCLVAYSGGVDSVFLAHVAHQVLGDKALAAIADSPSLPRRELEQALALGRQFQFPVRVIRSHEFENASYLANPDNRCYFCKHELFTELAPLAKAEGLAVIAYGENASDIGDHRPGAQAAAQFQVRAPLKEAGLTKADIRTLSAELGLPTADKPQMACLSSRVPYGEAVTPDKLQMIEQAEYVLRDLGFHDVRVRHHELRGVKLPSTLNPLPSQSEAPAAQPAPLLHLARIEVGPAEMPRFLENGTAAQVAEALKRIGYAHVTLDLQGYRRGSINEVIKPARPAASD